jgi:hypothetical protein
MIAFNKSSKFIGQYPTSTNANSPVLLQFIYMLLKFECLITKSKASMPKSFVKTKIVRFQEFKEALYILRREF